MNILKRFYLFTALILLSSISFVAFPQGMKIVTGNPDFKIKVTRCEASGSTVYMNLLLENKGDKEDRIIVYGGGINSSFAIDDEGNSYNESDFQVKIGKELLSSVTTSGTLYPDVPVKLSIQIEGVPESATLFRKIILEVQFVSGDFHKKVEISNVPIYREGDN